MKHNVLFSVEFPSRAILDELENFLPLGIDYASAMRKLVLERYFTRIDPTLVKPLKRLDKASGFWRVGSNFEMLFDSDGGGTLCASFYQVSPKQIDAIEAAFKAIGADNIKKDYLPEASRDEEDDLECPEEEPFRKIDLSHLYDAEELGSFSTAGELWQFLVKFTRQNPKHGGAHLTFRVPTRMGELDCALSRHLFSAPWTRDDTPWEWFEDSLPKGISMSKPWWYAAWKKGEITKPQAMEQEGGGDLFYIEFLFDIEDPPKESDIAGVMERYLTEILGLSSIPKLRREMVLYT